MDPETVIINGDIFKFVKRSRRGEVAVYTSGELYARVGERGVVENMLALHQKFDGFGFPVAKIMGVGEISAGAYFLEESLGKKHFSVLFREDMEQYGNISNELFEKFLKISEKFARAQLRSAIPADENSSLTKLIQIHDLVREMPEFGERILKRYEEALEILKVFPLVLTQGDFCSHNLFPAGVIDFEEVYCAPMGYDLVSNIITSDYFPAGGDYEFCRWYYFSPEQKSVYYKRIDDLYLEAGLPTLSLYQKHFEYCRSVWLTYHNHKIPKLQQFRYDLFKKCYLN